MAQNFPSDFYVACATVIPVLFLALIVQGGTYEAMLQTARQAAMKLPRRNRDFVLVMSLPLLAQVTFSCALLGEMLALTALYLGQNQTQIELFTLLATFELLFAVTAMPIAKWWQVQRAVNRQDFMPVLWGRYGPKFGYGSYLRPLWSERDKEAEQIRVTLRDAGCREWTPRHSGFVVEGGPGIFLVGCTLDNDVKASEAVSLYIRALAAAGFQVKQDQSDNRLLQVWAEDRKS